MLFSVIIPTFNRAGFLARTLKSVWSQSFTNFETIVVDNCSTDSTAELVRNFAGRLQFITETTRGAGVARNAGALHARGDYLAFLDSDDLWFPWTLASFAELVEQHDRPSIVAGRIVSFGDDRDLDTVQKGSPRADVFSDYLASHRFGHFVGSGMAALHREAFLKVGGYTDKPINSEDHDLILRMGDAPGFVQIASPITLGWRRHQASLTMDLSRSLSGSRYLIQQEVRGAYPGGSMRRRARRRIITRHVRPTALECLRNGRHSEAWALYWATFHWHVRLGRLKFLIGFPLLTAARRFRSTGGPAGGMHIS